MNKVKKEGQKYFNIDWQSQWERHGLNFHNGFVHIEVPDAVTKAWQAIKLTPGAGFGDLSHPTTRLLLKMMKDKVFDQYIVDVGCGSGVLALNAVALGAKHVYAIDIDKNALKHSHENAVLNGMENKINFYLPEDFQLPSDVSFPVILMNMIMLEQREAWNTLKSLHNQHGMCVTSGILCEHKQDYIHLVNEWGWKLYEESEEQGWLGLSFTHY